MSDKFYIYDLETGFPTEVTEETYMAHQDTKKRVWEALKPKIDEAKRPILLTGTGGHPFMGRITDPKLSVSGNINTWPTMDLPPIILLKQRRGGQRIGIHEDVMKTLGREFIEILEKRRNKS